jgi:hypothetical protein
MNARFLTVRADVVGLAGLRGRADRVDNFGGEGRRM